MDYAIFGLSCEPLLEVSLNARNCDFGRTGDCESDLLIVLSGFCDSRPISECDSHLFLSGLG
jgi:hypothetical protein